VNSFAEYAPEPNPETKKKDVVWFALNDHRPLFAFAGIWTEFSRIAWRSKPSWYVLATQDHTVHPDLQRWVSKRMGATVTEVASSHVPMLSQPDVVIGVIRKAAATVQLG
jgi:pimeloyl-ACP methyl ester carboxylesterase